MKLYKRIDTTNAVLHELADALRWVGLRDRIRCPECASVGTYKPYGSRLDRRKPNRPNRCWLCKWCGLYVGPTEIRKAWPNEKFESWMLLEEMDQAAARDSKIDTPRETMIINYRNYEVDPWKG